VYKASVQNKKVCNPDFSKHDGGHDGGSDMGGVVVGVGNPLYKKTGLF